MNTPQMVEKGLWDINASSHGLDEPKFTEKGKERLSYFMYKYTTDRQLGELYPREYPRNRCLEAANILVASRDSFSECGIQTGLIVVDDFLKEENFRKSRRIPDDRIAKFKMDLSNSNINGLQELFRDFWIPSEEKRIYNRKDIVLSLDSNFIDGQTRDINMTGIGFVYKSYCPPSKIMQLQLSLDSGKKLELQVEVIWCTKDPVGINFNTGARFIQLEDHHRETLVQIIG